MPEGLYEYINTLIKLKAKTGTINDTKECKYLSHLDI